MSVYRKNLMLDIIDVLQKRTNEKNRLNQTGIADILEQDYGYKNLKKSNRSTLTRNLKKVVGHFNSRKLDKIMKDYTGAYYYVHEFSDYELRLLLDSVLFSKHIPKYERKEMIKKLEKLTSNHFKSSLTLVESFVEEKPMNKQLFSTIEELVRAIEEKKKVSFYYEDYVIENRSTLRLSKRLDRDGKPREYIINPYELVTSNGFYYLICNFDGADNLVNYRVDRIVDIDVLYDDRTEIDTLKDGKNFNLEKYMSERVYMFAGEVISAKLKFKPHILGIVVDWFGTDIILDYREKDGLIHASVRVNREALKNWAIQYIAHVTVTEPNELITDIKKTVQAGLSKYD